jgi:hypothetical protein
MTIAKADDLITCPLTVGGASERSDLSNVCMGHYKVSYRRKTWQFFIVFVVQRITATL